MQGKKIIRDFELVCEKERGGKYKTVERKHEVEEEITIVDMKENINAR